MWKLLLFHTGMISALFLWGNVSWRRVTNRSQKFKFWNFWERTLYEIWEYASKTVCLKHHPSIFRDAIIVVTMIAKVGNRESRRDFCFENHFVITVHYHWSTQEMISLLLTNLLGIKAYGVRFLSYTLHTLHACNNQSKLRILKIHESSMGALFKYNCTLNTSSNALASERVA